MSGPTPAPEKLRAFTRIEQIKQLRDLDVETRQAMRAVAAVLPFRVNTHVVEHLIDWSRVPDDPIFQLTFPQPGMLEPADLDAMLALVRRDASRAELAAAALPIRAGLNPHPAGQLSRNVPRVDGERLEGLQHKYRETVLFFPTQGQTCHAYCTYCFRWAQFVGIPDLRFASGEPERLAAYVRARPEISDVLITGGDPLVMKTRVLRRYLEPLLTIEHLQTVRLGTKSVAYWPQRFVSDDDADDVLRLFEDVEASGKRLALMAHYSHPRELEPEVARQAVARIRGTGAVMRAQAPLVRRVNDDPATWRELWSVEVGLGVIPYYMFVARDTGARGYFEVPLARALTIYEGAYRGVSGLGRTARGPTMSSSEGKVLVDGVADVAGERVFVLKMIQARNPDWVNRPFFARFDATATWIDQLEPAFGADRWFWQSRSSTPRAAE